MESLTPPSSESDNGRSPAQACHLPAKRRKSESEIELDTARKIARTASRQNPASEESINGFITIHEENCELSKTEFHFPNLQTFIKDLNLAYTAKWSTRSIPYERVFVLLVRWEDDDLGVVQEINDLERIFRQTYRFDVETWAIPSTKNRYQGLINKIQSSLNEFDVDGNLFILYYGGHAKQEGQSQPIWVSTRQGGLSVQSSAFLCLFEEIDVDVLLLFDSCQAVPQAFDSVGKGVVSAITATGFEPSAIGTAAEVGSHSFTHSLIQVLGTLSIPRHQLQHSPPVSDVSLHSLLVTELKKCPVSLEKCKDGSFKRDRNGNHLIEPFRRRTPIYQFLSRNKTPRPIRLCPLKKNTGTGTENTPDAEAKMASQPFVRQQQPVFDACAPEVLVTVFTGYHPDTIREVPG